MLSPKKRPAEERHGMTLDDIRHRFGLLERCHRIGELAIRISQIDRVDDMVREVYPDAISDHGDGPVWMITWAAAFALAEYLVLNERVEGLRVLELGCGTAAPGIALERAGARVVSTDYDELALAVARYNSRINGCSSIKIRFLDWYRPDIEGSFDLIVGSEIAYFEKSFMPLLSILRRYLAPKGRIILSDQNRPQMKQFLDLCSENGFSHKELVQPVHLKEQSYSIRITLLSRRGHRDRPLKGMS